jgi:hypothetical protein
MFKLNKIATASLAATLLISGMLAAAPADAKTRTQIRAERLAAQRLAAERQAQALAAAGVIDPNDAAAKAEIARRYYSLPTNRQRQAYMESLSRQYWFGQQGAIPASTSTYVNPYVNPYVNQYTNLYANPYANPYAADPYASPFYPY